MLINPKIFVMRTNKLLQAFLAITLLFAISSSIQSQDSSEKSFLVYPTLGLGIGFFYPGDVNDYIEEEINAGMSSSYNTEIYAYLEVKGGITFRLKNVDFSALLEFDISPKFVTVSGGDDISYAFTRVAPEISANYYIPNKTGRNAFFIGAGVSYGFLDFRDFAASAPGIKLQAGYSMQFGKFNLQPYGCFRYTKATDSSGAIWGTMDQHVEIDLDYTGGQIGVIMSFHPKMSYR
jgi:hypothetical protein